MKLETFFEKFEQFAEAPNAVAMMRELVLQLAIQGKLVNQQEDEDTGCDLLETVRAERRKLVADRKIKGRLSAPVSPDEQPYEIPTTWRWARLAEVGYELGQKVPDQRFTYIDVGSIDSDRGRVSARVEILEPNEAPSRARKLVARGTVIYSTVRPYLRNIAIIDREFEYEPIASTAFGILHPFTGIDSRFLFYWLRSAPFTIYVLDGMKGMAYPAINDEKFYSGYIPVPPSVEQKRIVAKVDDLMALCDRLELQQQERDTQHAALAHASLARFDDEPTSANVNLLFHPSYAITPADLRKTILTLALQGKLVPQDPNDEPASELIEHIRKQKQGLSKKGEIGKQDLSSKIDENDIPYEVPAGWVWAHWDTIALKIGDIDHKMPDAVDKGIPYVSPRDFFPANQIDFDGAKRISFDDFVRLSAKIKPEVGDLIYPRYGTIGECRLVTVQIDFLASYSCAVIKTIPSLIDAKYQYSFSISDLCRNQARAAENKTTQANVGIKSIKEFLFPLPPLAEQRRIVAKVNQLMAMVDQLETQLMASCTTAINLMDAVVAELTA